MAADDDSARNCPEVKRGWPVNDDEEWIGKWRRRAVGRKDDRSGPQGCWDLEPEVKNYPGRVTLYDDNSAWLWRQPSLNSADKNQYIDSLPAELTTLEEKLRYLETLYRLGAS